MFIANVLLAPVANATKFIDNVYLDAQGNQQIEKVENANYPGDEKKKICQILSNINPTGQTNEISNILTRYSEEENTDNIKTLLIYSVGLTFVVNGMGIYLFNRKELK